ncbi:MAG TPA: AMP-binding protein [Candidatus Acidoferrum sp.]|nr:AMP-binding protein [Candidatus Acidoferrum sp.]
MANFLQNIFDQLQRSADRVILREVHGQEFISKTGLELLGLVEKARQWLRSTGIQPGERCGLIAANSIHWIAVDLALMAEGIVAVPLYYRQTPAELVAMLKDCQPRLVIFGGDELRYALIAAWPEMPQPFSLSEIFLSSDQPRTLAPSRQRPDDELLTIIYTSGTSGEPKGVCLTVGT